MFEGIYILLGETFNIWNIKTGNGFDILKFSVPLKLLFELYNSLVSLKEIQVIQDLPTEKKQYYFDISKKYYQDTDQRVTASKAAYILEYLTSKI